MKISCLDSNLRNSKNGLSANYPMNIASIIALLSLILLSSCGKALKQGAPIELQWKAGGSGTITSSAEIKNGSLWCGTLDKKVVKISIKDGKELSSLQTTGEVYFKPVISSNYVYFATFDKKLVKCDTNLNVLKEITLPDRTSSDLLLTDSLIIVPIRGNSLAVYSSNDLAFKYTIFPEDSAVIDSGILVEGNIIYYGGLGKKVTAINSSDEAILWQRDLNGYSYSKPIIFEDRIYVAADTSNTGGYIAVYSKQNGKELQRAKTDMQVFFGFAQDSSKLYYSSLDQNITAINPLTLKKEWQYDQMGDESATKLTEFEGRIYFGTTNKIIVCLNSQTGKIVFKKAISYSTGRAMVYNKDVYFLLADGSLYKVVY